MKVTQLKFAVWLKNRYKEIFEVPSRSLSSCYENTEKKGSSRFPWLAQVSLLSFSPIAPPACWANIAIPMLPGHLRFKQSSLWSSSTFTSTPALSPPRVYITESGSTIHPVAQVRMWAPCLPLSSPYPHIGQSANPLSLPGKYLWIVTS